MTDEPIPLTLETVNRSILAPMFVTLMAGFDSPEARVMLLAIGQQESRFQYRRQIRGPARGFWQFERAGGVKGVLRHPSTRAKAIRVARALGVASNAADVYANLEQDDTLAAAFARLLLFSDPEPLPAVHDADGAWKLYLRTWRPGKPHPQTWAEFHQRAVTAVTGNLPV